jgi:hypothetical protein
MVNSWPQVGEPHAEPAPQQLLSIYYNIWLTQQETNENCSMKKADAQNIQTHVCMLLCAWLRVFEQITVNLLVKK